MRVSTTRKDVGVCGDTYVYACAHAHTCAHTHSPSKYLLLSSNLSTKYFLYFDSARNYQMFLAMYYTSHVLIQVSFVSFSTSHESLEDLSIKQVRKQKKYSAVRARDLRPTSAVPQTQVSRQASVYF
jgi:hypothetical protein